ncbi:hypothetical protein KUTeg_001455 [Tegillarca granosa]|uniref:RRM domain-containing protein n=1 Tax=Tegillarca granosa TaxID=220873 RepID=A0ABQ9FRI8_TEGGR|nr:hypothetical protein KUTeg_001455 [Tegillarca granosa]
MILIFLVLPDATVYVGGLDDKVSEAILWELFLQAGPVVNVHMPKDRVTQSHQGYGFVEFMGEDDADYAIKIMNMIKLYGKPVRVNKASAHQKNLDVGANIFIGNLDPEVDEKLLYDTFSAFGVILQTPKIMRDPDTGNSKGYAFINFASFEASDASIEAMNGQYLCNRPITISYAFKKESKGERHGSAAERLLAQQNPLSLTDRPHQLFADAPPPPSQPPVPAPPTSLAPPPPPPMQAMQTVPTSGPPSSVPQNVPPPPVPPPGGMAPAPMPPPPVPPMGMPHFGPPGGPGGPGPPGQMPFHQHPMQRPPGPPMGPGGPPMGPPSSQQQHPNMQGQQQRMPGMHPPPPGMQQNQGPPGMRPPPPGWRGPPPRGPPPPFGRPPPPGMRGPPPPPGGPRGPMRGPPGGPRGPMRGPPPPGMRGPPPPPRY